MPKVINLVGRQYGNLLVIARRHNNKHGQSMWLVECRKCGKRKDVYGMHLRNGHTKFCSCESTKIQRERMIGNLYSFRHGFARVRQPAVYRAFTGNRERCNNPNSIHYKDYGDKGITFFDTFDEYWQAIGKDYPGPNHRLKRRNTDLGFDVDGNCFWEPIGTGINGVNFRKRTGTWQARIRVNGRTKHLGEFRTKEQAIEARIAAERKYMEAA